MGKLNSTKDSESYIFNLCGSEETLAGQDAQSPNTARRVLSFVPSISGELARESGQAKYLATQIGAPSKVGALAQYDWNDTSGVRHSDRFAATSTQLYREVGGAWILQSIMNPAMGLVTTTPFTDYPQFIVLNNLLHFCDGVTNWIYDGPNATFVVEGFPIPTNKPGIDTGTAGTLTTTVGRYYWYTLADETAGRVHESSTSPISDTTGIIVNKEVKVSVTAGTASSTLGDTHVTTTSIFTAAMVGQYLYINGTFIGVFASITNATNAVLAAGALATTVGGGYLVVPPRTTHIHFYGSETEGSKLGKFLGHIAVTANPPVYIDQATFITDPTSTIQNVDRPIRNDPPFGSRIVEVHKSRIFRRQETKPAFVGFSANEEVSSGNGNGSPQESNPGQAGAATLSDIVDVFAYPQEANRIRALKSHADALWMGTESGIIPLYGNSIDDFGIMQVVTIDGGVISRWGMASTSHGLVIFGYDKLLKNYPPISPIYGNITPQDFNVTDQLVEIGRPMRTKFLTILASDIDNVRILPYKYNSRDWLVVCYQDTSNVYHTYVYDWPTKSWWESQRGFVSVAVFEPTAGNKILVGGGTDGFVYVMDDVSGTYVNATLPAATFRTALINFNRPDIMHVPDYIEYETSTAALANDVTINFYLDPQNADSPGTPFGPMNAALVPDSASRYRAYFAATDGVVGVTCKRLMVEILVAASTNAGSLRGIMLKSDPASETIK